MKDEETQPEAEDEVEMTLENAAHPACQAWMGLLGRMSLEKFGVAVFVVGNDGGIRQVNPTGVYFAPGADDRPPDAEIVWKRPIVSQPLIRWIGWRDGQPWEIEFKPKGSGT